MKQTKEQFIEQVAELKHDNERLLLSDQLIRKEFAKAFSWYKSQGQFSYSDRELRLPTWEEIFVELGKVLAARNFMDKDYPPTKF